MAAAEGEAVLRIAPEAAFWLPRQTASGFDVLVSFVNYAFAREAAQRPEETPRS
jgi:hypothetical protein